MNKTQVCVSIDSTILTLIKEEIAASGYDISISKLINKILKEHYNNNYHVVSKKDEGLLVKMLKK
jgi:hypothetical protein